MEIKSKRLRSYYPACIVCELVLIGVLGVIVFFVASKMDAFERVVIFVHTYEQLEMDEVIIVLIYFFIAFFIFTLRRLVELRAAKQLLIKSNKKLQAVLDEVGQLRGVLPICASCKKIRDDDGYWQAVEGYISSHSEVNFSHGLCPDCVTKLYPNLDLNKNEED